MNTDTLPTRHGPEQNPDRDLLNPRKKFRFGTGHLTEALMALGDHRLRTFLSILGITIGIAAVIAVNTISKGGNYVVFSEMETFGLNSVWVYRDWRNDSPHHRSRAGSGINNRDYEAIKASASTLHIRSITPIVSLDNGEGRARKGSRYANANIVGVSEHYTEIVNDSVLAGRGINSNDINSHFPVAMLAPEIVAKLFPDTNDVIGQSIRIGNKRFFVIGLLKGKSRDFLSSIGSAGGQNANDRIIVPYSVLQRINGNKDIRNLQIEAESYERAANVAQSVKKLLQQRHRGDYSYASETMASYIATTDRILGGVAIVGIVAASISLLVGGMGIMNMMGTAVLERTREIGIRKAIGASERDILWQFLAEAVLISIAGGILGLTIGGLASVALAWATGFPLLPSLQGVLGALLVSITVGVLSGYLPARRAARMRPVEALRSD